MKIFDLSQNAKKNLFYYGIIAVSLAFLLPLILLFPIFFGIDGILYAGPIADGMAFIVSVCFVVKEY